MFIYKYMGDLSEHPIIAAVSSMFTSEDPSDNDYDPHEHRNVSKPTTYMETFVHMIKGSLGAGILAMPFAISKVGLVSGVIGLLFIGMFATWCIHILIQAQYKLCKKHRMGYLTYPQSMKLGVAQGPPCLQWSAKYFAVFVDFVLVVWQLGICCVYVVFIAGSNKQVCDHFGIHYNIRLHMVAILLPLILVDLPKNLKVLAPVSTAANVLTMVGILLVFVYLLNIDHGMDKVELFGDWKNIPQFTGITLFALEAVGVVLALEYHLDQPKKFCGWTGLFTICMAIITLLYGIVGIFGYIKYGAEAQGSVTLNLPQDEYKALATKVLFSVAVMLSFPLQNFVAYEILWHLWVEDMVLSKRTFCDYTLRIVLVIIPWLLALAIPQLGPFISLFGALCLSNLGVIFPGVLDFCVVYHRHGGKSIKLVRDFVIIALGLFALLAGSYTSIMEIIEAF